MIASQPYNPNRELSLVDIVVRELEKLSDTGRISPSEYSRAVDLARGQARILNNIYRGSATGLLPLIMFLLRQVRSR